jgi:sulfur-oxidizing protein SoxY
MQATRRLILKAAVAGAALLAMPRALLAAWPKAAFTSKSVDGAMKELFGDEAVSPSDSVVLTAPDIAENGAVVPITVSTTLEGAETIGLVVSENPSPLVASFDLMPDSVAQVSTRIKMGKTSDVVAVVKANGKLYSATKNVKVTIGGCGG